MARQIKYCFGLECGSWNFIFDEKGRTSVENEAKQKECFDCPLLQDCIKVTAAQKQNIVIDLLMMMNDSIVKLSSTPPPQSQELEEPEKERENFIEEETKNAIARAEYVNKKRKELEERMQKRRIIHDSRDN